MSTIVPGSFVVHAKLPDLGSGEVLSADKGSLKVRFASGERNFVTELVSQYLTVTIEGPAPRAATKAKRAKKAAAKPAAAKPA